MRVYEEHVTAISSGLVEVERASSPEQQVGIIEKRVPGSAQPEGRDASRHSGQN